MTDLIPPATDEVKIPAEMMNRITVLLAEYSTLRAEIIQRIGGYVQLGIAAGLILLAIVNLTVAIIEAEKAPAWYLVSPVLLLLTFFGGGWASFRAIKRANDRLSRHLIKLEDRINDIAKGKKLLTWEKCHAHSTWPVVAWFGGGRQR